MTASVLRPMSVHFDKEKATCLLGIEETSLHLTGLHQKALAQGFEKKKEFHITIIGFQTGAKILEVLARLPDKNSALATIETLVKETNWSFSLKNGLHHVAKDYTFSNGSHEHREAILQTADLPTLKSFYEKLNQILGTRFEVPPVHITLYTKGSDKEKSRMGVGINSEAEFRALNPKPFEIGTGGQSHSYKTIVLPTRAQPDTIVTIFILKKFGQTLLPGIETAPMEVWQKMPDGETEESVMEKGVLLVDLGGGRFDHHGKAEKTTASRLVSEYLGVNELPALQKLLEYAERDDFFGKGTISSDALDRAFGLSGLIAVLNKNFSKEPARVVQIVLPLLEAHYEEEVRRTEEMPKEFEEKVKSGKAEIFSARQRDKNLRVVIIDSENASMPGYLRSQGGGRFDVVAQWMSSGHVNILTRPTKHIDLRSLTALLRTEEINLAGKNPDVDIRYLAKTGRLPEVPEWYYDQATNSIQNGGLNPKEIEKTKISRFSLRKLIEVGLSEALWNPLR